MHLHELTALADTKLIHLTVAASCYNFESVSSLVQAQHFFAIFFFK